MHVAFLTWSLGNKANTVATIWHGDQLTKNHYGTAANDPVGPGLRDPGIIPDVPYTARHAQYAKQHKNHAGQTADTYPYSFWPDLPWDPLPNHYIDVMTPSDWVKRNPEPPREEVIRWDHWNTKSLRIRRAWMESNLYRDLTSTSEEMAWKGQHFLGYGTYGAAGLWVRCDEQNNITDRMVAKDASPSTFAWKNPDEWRDKLPREIRMHQLIDSTRKAGSHENLVQHYGHRLMMSEGRYRIFLELCDGGPLNFGLSEYWDETLDPKELPEVFIWQLFGGMVDACIILQQGNINEESVGWKPLVHNDFHIGNLMLKYDEDDQEVPKIVVMDFGRTFYNLHPDRTSESHDLRENDNPLLYRIAFGDGRYPPETQPDHEENTHITSKADVWSIGAIIFALLVYHYPEKGPYIDDIFRTAMEPTLVITMPFEPEDLLKEGGKRDITSEVHGYYEGSPLFEYTRKCLAWDPDERPTLHELREFIQEYSENMRRENPNLYDPHPYSALDLGKRRPQHMVL
ncbi:serine threonine kinase [Pyrenophora seminiperda CCB06]|uniref:Serine threonine kinase n=1 Tax=Pyrenophora seminiperda CCB06 TaxID=1302712 RepID=A0A3M7M847_9PLEO|nr:serine threonine kinase [Pyrenophora seminiperda CCB06]